MNTHTPGPWVWTEYDEESNRLPILKNSSGTEVCNFGADTSYDQVSGSEPESADRNLIAAAPDLLAALIDLADGYSMGGAKRAREAIAKATGETK